MSEDFVGEEATGVFVGTLLEDMIDTVARTGKLYCDVQIPEFFTEGYSHPLTYVPLWAMSLPLRKGDKVLVEFHQNDLTLPVLYKNESMADFDISQLSSKYTFGSGVAGGNVTIPTAVDTTSAQWIGKDSYIVKTENYTVIHQNNGFVLIDTNGKVYLYGTEMNIVSTGDTKIDSGGKTQIYSISTVEINTKADVNITATSGLTVNNHLKVTM